MLMNRVYFCISVKAEFILRFKYGKPGDKDVRSSMGKIIRFGHTLYSYHTSDRISIHESTTKLTSEIIKTCLAKDSKDNLSGMIENSRI